MAYDARPGIHLPLEPTHPLLVVIKQALAKEADSTAGQKLAATLLDHVLQAVDTPQGLQESHSFSFLLVCLLFDTALACLLVRESCWTQHLLSCNGFAACKLGLFTGVWPDIQTSCSGVVHAQVIGMLAVRDLAACPITAIYKGPADGFAEH